jgi:MFS family permease
MKGRHSQFREGATVLSFRPFRRLFLAQVTSLFGDQLSLVAVAFAVIETLHSATDLGLILAVAAVSQVATLLVGGVIADRYPARLVMVASDCTRCVAQFALAVALLTDHASVAIFAVTQAIRGGAAGFFDPSFTTALPELVPAQRLQGANALRGLGRSLAGISGPAVAGVIVAVASPAAAIATDSVTFAASALLINGLPATTRERSSRKVVAELREGWRAFAGMPWVVALVAWAGLAHLLVLAPLSVVGPLVSYNLYGGVVAWSVVNVALSVGTLAGGLFAVGIQPRRPLAVCAVAPIGLAPALVLYGLGAQLALTAVGFAVAGLLMAMYGSVWSSSLQRYVRHDVLGRVSAYDWIVSYSLHPVGLAATGPALLVFGPRNILIGGAVWTAVTCPALLLIPAIRQMSPVAQREDRVEVATA